MKKVPKKELTVWEKLKGELQDAHAELQTAVINYNDALVKLRDFRDELVQQMADYQSERSGKWHDSDAGFAYVDFAGSWENLELDDEAEEVEMPDLDSAMEEVEG